MAKGQSAKTNKANPKAKAKSAPKAKSTKVVDTAKYGIDDLAKVMKLKEASVRVKLRNAGIAKSGKAYGWNSKSEIEEVAKKLAPKEAKKAA